MKRLLYFIKAGILVFPLCVHAQTNIADTTYQRLKGNHQLDESQHYVIISSDHQTHHHALQPLKPKASNCACYTPHDASWTLAMTPNDDGSTANIPIPFNFCLYGTNYSSLWINNNGNVTFDAPYFTFSAVGFPSATYVMVAPFWGDVDTRGIGEVWYKITPSALYVNWENVGYFDSYTDKTNTFSLIITDGNDPVIGVGNNVAFCYQDMQWTTGDASSGVNGFGGVAATVGCNKGDGTSFVQFGRFDSPGTAYFGPYATNNGVSWLDNQSLIFNACNATNIAPLIADGFGQCDTIRICQGDTLLQTITFLSPESGQTTTLSATSSSPDFTILNITNGNTADIDLQLIGNTPGIYTISITATDDGTPPQVVTFPLVFEVTPNNTPDPVITGDTIICPGVTSVLSAGAGYDSYVWNNGGTADTTLANSGGIYSVEVSLNGCRQYDSITVVSVPSPVVSVPDSITCDGVPVTFNATSTGTIASYNWNFTGGTPATSSNAEPVVSFPTPGTYPFTLTVANEEGCTTTVNQNMLVLQGSNPDFGVYPICISRFTFDPLPIAGDSAWVVDWYMGDGTTYLDKDTSYFNHNYVAPGNYNVTMVVTNIFGCVDSITKVVEVKDTISVTMPNVLVRSSTQLNNKVDMEEYKPGFNLCIDYTYTVYDRWGVKVFETNNDPLNPDLFCNHCFQGKSLTGTNLSPGIYYYVMQGNFNVKDVGFITVFE